METTTTTTAAPVEQPKHGKEKADALREEREAKRIAKLEELKKQ